MTKIKFCGLSRPEDIAAANLLKPDYVGYVLAPGYRRTVTPEKAGELNALLDPEILAVGVFVDENPGTVADLLNRGIIRMAQLHGHEDEAYLQTLRSLTDRPLIRAFRIRSAEDVAEALASTADLLLLDSGTGTGNTFDWSLIRDFPRPYLLAGGLDAENVSIALKELRPFGVDVSSGIETDHLKDPTKMAAFAAAVRKDDRI